MSNISRDRQTPIAFVVGMHRSGTSALTRVLNLAGLRMLGELMDANQDNPLGYWEPKKVVDFNTALLRRLDRHWADPKPLEDDLMQRVGAEDVAQAASILQAMDPPDGTLRSALVIKDPRLCRLMPVSADMSKSG